MSIAGDTTLSWEELPLKYGEDSREWNNLMARYSHTGCPGCGYEDNCYEPSDCASKGRCRLTYQKWQDIARKEAGRDSHTHSG